jgi:pilus assembly protein CpaB
VLSAGGGALPYRIRLAMIRRRRAITAALLAAAVAAGLQAVRPPEPPWTAVMVAARDLPAGHRLAAADVAVGAWYPAAVPAGTLQRPAGRVLASAIRRGEPLTDTRVLGDRLLAGLPVGTVAVSVRLADPASALVVRPGERADVLAGPAEDPLSATALPADALAGDPAVGESVGGSSAGGSSAAVVVRSALVLAIPSAGAPGAPGAPGEPADGAGLLGSIGGSAGDGADPGSGSGPGAGVLLLAVTGADAVRLAEVTGRRPLTVALHDSMSR